MEKFLLIVIILQKKCNKKKKIGMEAELIWSPVELEENDTNH